MKKIVKWILIVVGSLVVLAAASGAVLYQIASSRLSGFETPARQVVMTEGEAALQRGEHLVRNVALCISCHGPGLEGTDFFDEPGIGYIPAPNLTRGSGGVSSAFSTEDWVRAIRHGVGVDGRVLGGMPSQYYANLTDSDLAAIIVYISSVPPADNVQSPRSLSPIATIFYGLVEYKNLPVSLVDHANAGSHSVEEGVSAAYGEYLSEIALCRDCHGAQLEGRSPDASQPGPPPGPNLTPGGGLKDWTQDDFKRALRSGRTPDGRQLSDEMPWPYFSGMTDVELEALWVYLSSLPPR